MKKEKKSFFRVKMAGSTVVTESIIDYQTVTYLFLLPYTIVYSRLTEPKISYSTVYKLFMLLLSDLIGICGIIYLLSGSIDVFDILVFKPILAVIPDFFAFVCTCMILMEKLHQSFIWCGLGGISHACV